MTPATTSKTSPAPGGLFGRFSRLSSLNTKWWTLIAVCLGTFMLLLDVTIVNVALPDIQKSLHSSFSDLQWVVDAYALTLASLLLTAGSLADLFGRRLLFTIGLVWFTLGSLSCGLARSSEWLILSRAGQGIGGAIMFSTSLALLAQAFQGRERGVAFGVWGSITGVAVAVGPVVGGILTSGLSWKWILFRQRADRCLRHLCDRLAGGGVPSNGRPATGLGRVRRVHGGADRAGLRPHPLR